MSMNPVNWFEIPVSDMDQAKRFYEAVLEVELELNESGPMLMAWFPAIPNGHGAAGTLVKADGYNPAHDGTLVYFSVPDIEATLDKVEANGGELLLPKMSIGENGFIGHFKDTEGNRVGLHSQE